MRIPAEYLALVALLAGGACSGPTATYVPSGAVGAAAARVQRDGSTLWIPAALSTFAIQYGGSKLDTNVKAAIYDVDGFDTSAPAVAGLHAKGRRVVCYIDVGTWENWRPDAKKFPQRVLGNKDGHWAGERWLDIRQLSILRPIMMARFEMCRDKGFDAVDPDNIDGYQNRTGFPLDARQQLTYDRWVAQAVHSVGMSVAQKNDNAQVGKLRSSFDWAVLEQCYAQGWCGQFTSYSDDGRLVVDIEYGTAKAKFVHDVCPKTESYRETALLKHLSLDAWVVTCPKS
ncbi:MAG: endo alpha-1,4 polygalactosaminidase [Candidatus Eremiobacteraeota bacterium]|nr:endo alpha-1,4 polygalactosaminidase [Candidatus Eremiobacteraeota bacterium]MBV8372138.1 endo alpha-1,4 polygalactosaminidase [Candidatus Eremiobacteraeota bacterium]